MLRRAWTRTLTAVVCAAFVAAPAVQARAADALPPIKHVFVIVLENEGIATTFGQNTPSPFLSQTLPKQGAILLRYFATGHLSNDNYLSMISGQAPNALTQMDCANYVDFSGTQVGEFGQLLGQGCVFPASVPNVADQLEGGHFTWKAYMEDMGNDPARESATCGHPVLGQPDHTQLEEAPSPAVPAGDAYATKHNPFVYFHSVIDNAARCNADVVNLRVLENDLKSASTTPNLSYIVPGLCHDGHNAPCANGEPGGLISADQWLRRWVPLVVASPAFADGLLVITFDESEIVARYNPQHVLGFSGDASACCNERAPNVAHAGLLGPGGGYIGAVALSPYILPGTVSQVSYNHYSLLRTIETVFGLGPIGYAAQPEVQPFGSDVFTKP